MKKHQQHKESNSMENQGVNQNVPPKDIAASKPIRELFLGLLKKFRGVRLVASIFIIIFLPLPVLVGYLCYVPGFSWLYSWATEVWWHWIPAVFLYISFAVAPGYALAAVGYYAKIVIETSLSISEEEIEGDISELKDKGIQILDKIEVTDKSGLLPLIRYSAEHLQAYYRIGEKQSRRSFLFSIIAMWAGFVFMLAGFSLFVAPIEKIGLRTPTNDIQVVVIAIGAIIEFISVLFLWMHRSAMEQLTYYYNRQIHTHNVVMCFRIADSMKDQDSAKNVIISKVMERLWTLERVPTKGAGWFRRIVSQKDTS